MPTKTNLPNFTNCKVSPCRPALLPPLPPAELWVQPPPPCPNTRSQALSVIPDRIRCCSAATCARTPPAAAADTYTAPQAALQAAACRVPYQLILPNEPCRC